MAYGVLTSKLEAVNQMLSTIGQARVASLQTSGEAYEAQKVLEEVDKAVQTEGWHFNRFFDEPLSLGTATIGCIISEQPSTAVNTVTLGGSTAAQHFLEKGEAIAIDSIANTVETVNSDGISFVAGTAASGQVLRYSQRIAAPTNALQLDTSLSSYSSLDPIVRGRFLYDKYDGTYQFTTDLKVNIVYQVAFEQGDEGEPALPEHARRFITMRASRIFAQRYVGDPQLLQFVIQEERDAWTSFVQIEGETADHSIFGSALAYYTVERNTTSNVNPVGSLYRVVK